MDESDDGSCYSYSSRCDSSSTNAGTGTVNERLNTLSISQGLAEECCTCSLVLCGGSVSLQGWDVVNDEAEEGVHAPRREVKETKRRAHRSQGRFEPRQNRACDFTHHVTDTGWYISDYREKRWRKNRNAARRAYIVTSNRRQHMPFRKSSSLTTTTHTVDGSVQRPDESYSLPKESNDVSLNEVTQARTNSLRKDEERWPRSPAPSPHPKQNGLACSHGNEGGANALLFDTGTRSISATSSAHLVLKTYLHRNTAATCSYSKSASAKEYFLTLEERKCLAQDKVCQLRRLGIALVMDDTQAKQVTFPLPVRVAKANTITNGSQRNKGKDCLIAVDQPMCIQQLGIGITLRKALDELMEDVRLGRLKRAAYLNYCRDSIPAISDSSTCASTRHPCKQSANTIANLTRRVGQVELFDYTHPSGPLSANQSV